MKLWLTQCGGPAAYAGWRHATDLRMAHPAITGAEDSALIVRRVEMTDRGYEHDVGIFRIDRDLADVVRVLQPEIRPGLSRVGGLIHPVAEAR